MNWKKSVGRLLLSVSIVLTMGSSAFAAEPGDGTGNQTQSQISGMETVDDAKTEIKNQVDQLAQPVIQSAEIIDAGTVKLSWSKVCDAQSYVVYRKDNNQWKKLAEATKTTVNLSKQSYGKKYQYSVRACRPVNGKNEYSTYAKAYSKKIVPQSVTLSSVTAVSYDSNKITWKKTNGADGYRIYRKCKNASYKSVGTVSAKKRSFTDDTVSCGTTYTYDVRAYWNNKKTKTFGTYNKTGKTVKTVCAAPVLKSAKASYDKSIKITWNRVAGASGYRIYRKKTNGEWERIGTRSGKNNTSYTDKNRTVGTRYTYTVRAYRTVSGKKVCGAWNKKGISKKAVGYDGSVAFQWPVPSTTYISSYFGPRSRPTAGASSYHKGIDIAGTSGSAICASAAGTVKTAAYSSSKGNYVVIYHGDGMSTEYMHCSKLLVSKGENVATGEKIAKMGSTGIATGSHLHFSVLENGNYVNPLNYVTKK